MNMEPSVSVIIPAYNAGKFIAESLISILNQSHQSLEVLIVDDGSNDDTLSICQKFASEDPRIRLLHHEGNINRGPSHSRALALKFAKGEYIAFCDADDCMHSLKIKKQVDALRNYKNIILVHTGVEIVADDKYEEKMLNFIDSWFQPFKQVTMYDFLKTNFLEENHICLSSVMLRRTYLDKIPFSFKQFFQHEDWLMLILLAQYGLFMYMPEKLTIYRYHKGSATYNVMINPFRREYSRMEMYFMLMGRLPMSWLFARVKIIAYILKSLLICIFLSVIGFALRGYKDRQLRMRCFFN